MRRLLTRLLLLLSPLAVLASVELLLPWDAWTFRTWEAVAVSYRFHYLAGLGPLRMPKISAIPGPFVPLLTFSKIEEGDLGHHTQYAVRRPVLWWTDEYGFRIRPGLVAEQPQLVVVGDSEVVGTGLTQEDTLAETLVREHGISSYPYAPALLADFLGDQRWERARPRFLVVEAIERNVVEEYATRRAGDPPARRFSSSLARTLETALNRIDRLSFVSWVQTQVNGRKPPIARDGVLFLRGDEAPSPGGIDDARAVIGTLSAYADQLRARGTRLALLVIPDKENTYADLFPDSPKRKLIAQLRSEAQRSNVDWIELEEDFAAARRAGTHPQQLDDTHWNAHGVRLAARNIAAWIKEKGRVPDLHVGPRDVGALHVGPRDDVGAAEAADAARSPARD